MNQHDSLNIENSAEPLLAPFLASLQAAERAEGQAAIPHLLSACRAWENLPEERMLTLPPTEKDRAGRLYLHTLRRVTELLPSEEKARAEAMISTAIKRFPEWEALHEERIRFYVASGRQASARSAYGALVGGARMEREVENSVASSVSLSRNKKRKVRRKRALALVGLTASGALFGAFVGLRTTPVSVPVSVTRPASLTGAAITLGEAQEKAYKAFQEARYAEAEQWGARSVRLARQANDLSALAVGLSQQGETMEALGRRAEAKAFYLEALEIRRKEGAMLSVAHLLELLGGFEMRDGNYLDAEAMLQESLSIRLHEKEEVGIVLSMRELGRLAARRGHLNEARYDLNFCLAQLKTLEKPAIRADVIACLGLVARDEGKLVEARRLITQSLNYWKTEQHPRWIATTEGQLGTVAFKEGNLREAETLWQRSLATYQSLGDRDSAAEMQKHLARLR